MLKFNATAVNNLILCIFFFLRLISIGPYSFSQPPLFRPSLSEAISLPFVRSIMKSFPILSSRLCLGWPSGRLLLSGVHSVTSQINCTCAHYTRPAQLVLPIFVVAKYISVFLTSPVFWFPS